MRSQSVITFLFACLAFGQPPVQENLDRVLHFTHTGNAQDIQEIATSIRAISEIRQLSADTDQRTLTLRGTPTQIALAEWLFVELDRLSREDSATHEYHLAGAPDDMVRVFYLTAAKTIQDLQEVATLVRTIADIRWACTYNAPRAITLRGTAGEENNEGEESSTCVGPCLHGPLLVRRLQRPVYL